MNLRGVLIVFLVYFVLILGVSAYFYFSSFNSEDDTRSIVQKQSSPKDIESNRITAKDETDSSKENIEESIDNKDIQPAQENTGSQTLEQDSQNSQDINPGPSQDEQEDYSEYTEHWDDIDFANIECSQAQLDYKAVCCDQKITCEIGTAPMFSEEQSICLCETLEKIQGCLSLNCAEPSTINPNYLNDGICECV